MPRPVHRRRANPTLLAALLAAACARGAPPEATKAAAASPAAGAPGAEPGDAGAWDVLFDGRDLARWRGFRMDHVPAAWSIQDGAIALAAGEGGERADLVTRDTFRDFELELEWKISPGGNSGIIYRVGEDEAYTWRTGPEMQVLDNERAEDNHPASHRAGALYDLYAPSEETVRPAGEWNHVRIVVRDGGVEHWLNGKRIVAYQLGSDDWKAHVQASKFRTMPAFGTVADGHIALQDHGAAVWYRNIRIRRL
ncbi:MAG TPA: DUF1080 domain-containing protein [Longimicrobiales bacterium]|nr:DUF1080 domain-containing protein [Longimicrobiales bacterium]